MQQLFFILILFIPKLAFAADINSDTITSILQSLIDLTASGPARLIFVLAIIGIGYGTMSAGRIEKLKALAMVFGIMIVTSSGYIAEHLGVGV